MKVAPFITAAGWMMAASAAGAMGLFGGNKEDVFAECRDGAVGAGDIGGPFTLVSETGETMTDKDVITGPTLLYFGYTLCPDVCPYDAARNAEAVEILESRGVEILPVFISVDAERDTPETLDDFTANLHPRMLGLTGTTEQVRTASQAYRTYYAKAGDADDEYYLIDHSTFSYLVFPDHGFVEYFRREVTPEEMADRIECFVRIAE